MYCKCICIVYYRIKVSLIYFEVHIFLKCPTGQYYINVKLKPGTSICYPYLIASSYDGKMKFRPSTILKLQKYIIYILFYVSEVKISLLLIKHKLQVILFEINCAIFYTNLHELFSQFISWTNWVNSGKFMDNHWIAWLIWKKFTKIS